MAKKGEYFLFFLLAKRFLRQETFSIGGRRKGEDSFPIKGRSWFLLSGKE